MKEKKNTQSAAGGVNRLTAGLTVGSVLALLSLVFTVWLLGSDAGRRLVPDWLAFHPTVVQGVPDSTLDSLLFAFSNGVYGFIDGFILGYLGAAFYGFLRRLAGTRRARRARKDTAVSAG